MANNKQITAKHLNLLFAGPENKLMLDFNNDQSKPQRIELSRPVAHRIKTSRFTQDYSNDFILFVDENNVVQDIDTRPKTSNLPMEVDDTPQENLKDKVIFKKNRLGEVSIFKNLGISDSTEVDNMRKAVEARLASEEGLKADDVLDETYFVGDIRDNGTFIHVELLHG